MRFHVGITLFALSCFGFSNAVTKVQDFNAKTHRAIAKSVTFKKSTVSLSSKSEQDAAIVVRGNNLVVDFGGLTLQGPNAKVDPDQRAGFGVLVEGNNVTIKNLNVHGYKFGIIARRSQGLKLVNCDASRNWRQRLLSTPEAEDLSDWMSFHHNEKDEWMKYGAGFYLTDCDDFLVEKCTATSGQSGLMLTRCDSGVVRDNNFSFLSAIGLGMYRSSDNKIYQNRIDWCVRGYSHGVYNRGQDSAGILIYEQSNRNIFAFNSVTHGGDGFFLWAGQTTMDTGQGGCNDNLVAFNDFSHAPTNGIEATFSRNKFIGNLMMECWHGVWGGFSYDLVFRDNIFAYNGEAIAIEHGQNNKISRNTFYRDRMGIRLWANEKVDPNWGYGKARDTRSRDYLISENTFEGVALNSVRSVKTLNLAITENQMMDFQDGISHDNSPGHRIIGNFELALGNSHKVSKDPVVDQNGVVKPPVSDRDYHDMWILPLSMFEKAIASAEAKQLANQLGIRKAEVPKYPSNLKRGRAYMHIDEWGPYDFQSPRLRRLSSMKTDTQEIDHTFEILGPAQNWEVERRKGVVRSRIVGKNLVVTSALSSNFAFDLVGDKGGKIVFEDKNVEFRFSGGIYQWDSNSDPRENRKGFAELLKGKPAKTFEDIKLNFGTSGDFLGTGIRDKFATLATSELEVEEGLYELNVTTDDGCRVYLDDKLVLDEWRYQGPTNYKKTLKLGGKHKLRVEHFEIDGYAALKVNLKRI